MSYKNISLRAKMPESAATEIMYEIAACRADKIDLVRVDIAYDEGDGGETKKIMSTVIKVLKNMKAGKGIHFFATKQSFESFSTEASFLQNKYPEIFSSAEKGDECEYIYIKL